MTFHLFTVASDKEKMWRLTKTTQQHGLDLKAIEKIPWTGYVDKITAFLDAIRELPEDDIVCFVDAYDVICFADEREILTKFYSYDCRILLSSEVNCYPGENKEVYDYVYQELGTRDSCSKPYTNYLYVNSGGYIGYKADIQKMLEWKEVEEIKRICELGGDQNYFTHFFLEHALDADVGVKLDWRQLIFQSLYRIRFPELSMVHGRLFNEVLGTFPCFAHFNGLNLYDYKMVNESSGQVENMMDAMVHDKEESFCKTIKLEYRLLYYLVYNGVEVKEISQMFH
jgi:hypothetical protein